MYSIGAKFQLPLWPWRGAFPLTFAAGHGRQRAEDRVDGQLFHHHDDPIPQSIRAPGRAAPHRGASFLQFFGSNFASFSEPYCCISSVILLISLLTPPDMPGREADAARRGDDGATGG